jgi:hypothetical protein
MKFMQTSLGNIVLHKPTGALHQSSRQMLFASLHEGLRTWVESRNVWGIASFGIQRIWECELKCKKDVLIDDKCASIFWLQENGDNGSLMSLPWQSEYRTSQ